MRLISNFVKETEEYFSFSQSTFIGHKKIRPVRRCFTSPITSSYF